MPTDNNKKQEQKGRDRMDIPIQLAMLNLSLKELSTYLRAIAIYSTEINDGKHIVPTSVYQITTELQALRGTLRETNNLIQQLYSVIKEIGLFIYQLKDKIK